MDLGETHWLSRQIFSLQGRSHLVISHLEICQERNSITGAERVTITLHRATHATPDSIPPLKAEEQAWIWADWRTLWKLSIPLTRAAFNFITSKSFSLSEKQGQLDAPTETLRQGTASVMRRRRVPLMQ